jgi:eukaryotic-like serine/threonine-protein kinase
MHPEKLGPYRIEKLLGRGGMGAVYVGRHETTGERAAIKLLSDHLADDETFRQRFKQEIDALKQLLHPNIVQLHGYGEEQGHLYYVMELVEGRSLQDELSAGRRFNWREVARIGVGIASALKHAHDRGIIHRDLKPANLLIDAEDHVKLTDFGIAKLYGGTHVTAEGGVIGTADYMAPEQAGGKQITSRSDLYALGSVFYALLTGKPPFGGKSLVDVVVALQNERPVPVRRLAPDTPIEFEKIIHQLLEKDPQQRIPTALAVANRLKAMEHGLSLETRVHDLQDVDEPAPPNPSSLPAAHPSASELESGVHAAKTEIIDSGSRPTSALPGAEGAVAPGHAPTSVTGLKKPSQRTAWGTQAGKGTGVQPQSGLGTDASESAAAASENSLWPAKATRFTTVSEQELRGRRESDDTSLKQWILTAVLAAAGLMVTAAAIYWATRPASADRLYATVKQAAERGSAEDLIPVEGDLTRFIQLYPGDPRAAEIQEYADALDRYRLERRLVTKPGRAAKVDDLTPVQRAYQDAFQVAASDPEAALARFEALMAVYEGSLDVKSSKAERHATEQCLDLARQQMTRLRPVVKKQIEQQKAAISQQLERADKLAAADRAVSSKIWQGIVTLYGDKQWAHDLVGQAKERLNERQP